LGLSPGTIQTLFAQQSSPVFGNNSIDLSIIAVNGIPSDDLLTNNSATIQFNINANRVPFSLSLTLDDRPKDTSWELRKQSGALVANGGNYEIVGESDYQNFCLEKDSCYVFKIFDSEGDGFSGFANFVNLTTGLSEVSFNGFNDTFSYVIAYTFCAYDICNNLSLAATVTPPNNANMNNGKITLTATGGTPAYRYSKNNGTLQLVNIFTGLVPGIYNMKVVDVNGCETVIDVPVGSVATNTPAQLRQVELYPNPTAGPVWISLPAQPGEDFLTGILTNSEGRELRKINLARFDDTFFGTFSIQKNPAGIYFLSIMDRKGTKIAEKRIQKI
jgi:SprB repeat